MLSTYIQSKKDEEGFTLIELLVVVIIIGILAAIAIPVFLSQRENAWNSAMQSDLRNAAVAQESHYTGASPAAYGEKADIVAAGFNESEAITLTVEEADAEGYCMQAVHSSSDRIWTLDSATGAPAEGALC